MNEEMSLPLVRTAVPSDAEAACRAVRRSISEVAGPDYGHQDTVISDWLEGMTSERIRELIHSDDECAVVATTTTGEVVGFGSLARSGWIQQCYVTPEVLHQGYGGALLQAMEQQARGWGLNSVRLNSSITAKAFYERNGYRQTGEPKMFGSTPGDFPFTKKLM